MSNSKVGIITEQGDLGLGFDPVTESEQSELLKRQQEEEAKKKGRAE
jgi:hypothetical protein